MEKEGLRSRERDRFGQIRPEKDAGKISGQRKTHRSEVGREATTMSTNSGGSDRFYGAVKKSCYGCGRTPVARRITYHYIAVVRISS